MKIYILTVWISTSGQSSDNRELLNALGFVFSLIFFKREMNLKWKIKVFHYYLACESISACNIKLNNFELFQKKLIIFLNRKQIIKKYLIFYSSWHESYCRTTIKLKYFISIDKLQRDAFLYCNHSILTTCRRSTAISVYKNVNHVKIHLSFASEATEASNLSHHVLCGVAVYFHNAWD